MDDKYCPTCDTTKSVEAFSKHRARDDGLQFRCKSCERAYREANKEAIKKKRAGYRAVNKEVIKKRRAAHYEDNKESIKAWQTAYRAANKEAIKERTVAYYEANKEAIKARMATYREANREYWSGRNPYMEHPTGIKECRRKHGMLPISSFPRDSTSKDGLHKNCRECAHATRETREDREAWRGLTRTRPPCAYCGAPSEHIDHVHPVSKGGRDIRTNYLPACAADNLSKNDKWVYEWLFGAESRQDEEKPAHYRTWDAVFIKELFHEIENGPASSRP